MSEPKKNDGFPDCIHLSISFNEHAVYYQSVQQWMDDEHGGQRCNWESDEEKKRAIENDSVWTCQWYPITPIGFYVAAASSYQSLMAFVARSKELGAR
jgi:hypothetical protein